MSDQYDNAIANYSDAIRLNPNDAETYFNRGDAYANDGNYDKAIADFSEAIRLIPNGEKAYCCRGLAYGEKGDYCLSIADYSEAIRLSPDFAAVAYYGRSVTYENKGDLDSAVADLEAALRIDPNDSNVLKALEILQEKMKQITIKNSLKESIIMSNNSLSFTDPRDGRVYKTVKIGNQVWMAENLSYNANDSKCYDDESANCDKYGRLYNWETAKKACPAGWHLPNDAEWETLVGYAGGSQMAGKKLKSTNGWNNNGNGTDEYGFSALPGAGNVNNNGGNPDQFRIGNSGFWWSATGYDYKANSYYIGYNEDAVSGGSIGRMAGSFSVRCLQD